MNFKCFLSPFCSLQFVVVKEHQNLRNGRPSEALKVGLAADVGQFSPLDPGE